MNRALICTASMFVYLLVMTECIFAGENTPAGSLSQEPLNPVTASIRMYQKFFSGANGHRCPMTPSCSRYSAEVFRKHGYLMGWIMTSDRLLRCGRDEIRLSETRGSGNNTYSYDPVENNDFWWYKR